MTFWAYMLHCRGGVFYTSHTDDLERRIADHKSGLLRGFARALLPVELVWTQEFPTRYEALAAERQIKGWSRAKKLALIRGDWEEMSRLAKGKSGPSTSSGRTDLEVSENSIAAMLADAERAHPRECCGLLLGQGTRIALAQPAANVHPDPAHHFEIDPGALIAAHRAQRAGGLELVGFYHSHPNGRSAPSAEDFALAEGAGRIWAIIANGNVLWWRDGKNGFEPLSSRVAAG